MAVPDTKYVRTPDGTYIAYQVVGDGPHDIVMGLHYYESNIDLIWDEPDWSPFLMGLARNARVILHDQRGLGVSSRSVPVSNLETQAADLLVVLDAIGSERPILASSWRGGAVLVTFAATHPERVGGLIWYTPRARAKWAEDYPWGEKYDDYELEFESDVAKWGLFDDAKDLAELRERERMGLPPEADAPNVSPEKINIYARTMRNSATPEVVRELLRIEFDTDVRALLPLVRAPAALVTGTLDDPHDLEEARYIAALMPNASIHTVEGRAGAAVEPFVRIFRKLVGMAEPDVSLDTMLATVLFTDIVGSTARQASMGDTAWKSLLERHNAVVRSALMRWRGVERDNAGDGFFVTFDGPARAIRCASEVVDAVRTLGLEIRAGVNTGECEIVEGKLTGVAVTTGARIAALAGPSQILISQTVRDLAAGSGFTYSDAGDHELKGLPGTWRLWSVSTSTN